jgi:cysteine desulfurase/selenocysteine lyase
MIDYLNNAGAGLMSAKTLEVIIEYLKLESKIGAYHAAAESKSLMQDFYSNAAKIINANSDSEIAFTDSASRGWNMVVYGAMLRKGAKIVTLSSEFGTNLVTLFDLAKKLEGTVIVINCDSKGLFSLDEIETELKNGAALVAISHAVAHGSIVNPVDEVGVLAKKYGAIYIVDGCQAVGQFKVDVQQIQCDAYMTTGRKWLCGPRGTGFLYVKQSSAFRTTQLDLASADLIIDSQSKVTNVEIRKDAKQFELWERSIANMLGLSYAISECLAKNISEISEQIQFLSNRLRKIVYSNPKLNLIGEVESSSGIIGFYLEDASKEEILKEEFKKNDLRISTMSDWDCPLHFPKTGAKSIFRLSPHYTTSDDTIEIASKIITSFSY